MTKEVTDRKKEGSAERGEKPNRIEESRNMELHDVYKHAIMNMQHHSPLYIDPDIIPQGKEYSWKRESVYGEPDTKRMVECRMVGWTPVPSDRHPELSYHDFFGRTNHMKSYIFHSGLVLCERDIELSRLEKEKYEKQNYMNLISLQGTEHYMGEPTIPVRNNSQTYITKNVSAN
jgi:hypothetical protein